MVVDPTLDAYGAETHPAFGMIQAARVNVSPPSAVLFDSDIRHGRTVRVTVVPATRKRELNRDWVHGGSRPLVEVEMSEAQWASFVSSMNTSGVPCTIRATETDLNVPGLAYDPRLAQSMDEVRTAADRAFADALAAMDAYDAVAKTGTAKQKREALDLVRSTLRNATPNVEFAAKSLTEHAENVVQRARADVEAMVTSKAGQLGGLPVADAKGLVALPVGTMEATDS